jgi:hypothetical protein
MRISDLKGPARKVKSAGQRHVSKNKGLETASMKGYQATKDEYKRASRAV